MAKQLLSNFSKGELAPQLYARVDIPQYNAAVKEAKNFVIQRYGGMSFRPGLRFAGEVDDATQNYRLVPFKFSNTQAYVHLHGPLQLRVLARGGFVVEDDLKITAITQAPNAQLTIPFHGLSAGDRVYLDGIAGMVELNGRTARVVSVVDASNITIDVNTSAFAAFVSSTGITRAEPPAAPPPPPAPLPDPPEPPPPPPSTGGDDDGFGGPRWWRTFDNERPQ